MDPGAYFVAPLTIRKVSKPQEQAADDKGKGVAYSAPSSALKTKRQLLKKPPFGNIFQALLTKPELLFEVAKHLEIQDLVSLYAISRDFHGLVNYYFSSFVLGYCKFHAPSASEIYKSKTFANLAISDPVGRVDPQNPRGVRQVPGFRWLRMVLYRERMVDALLKGMAEEGHHLPEGIAQTLQLLWILMGIPSTLKRIGFMNNTSYWKNQDLFSAMMFFIKFDMMLTDPIDGFSARALRMTLLGQKSLTPLACLVSNPWCRTQIGAMQLSIWWRQTRHLYDQEYPQLGIPASEIGRGHLEYWGARERTPLMQVDELVIRECVGRNLDLRQDLETMMIWGYLTDK
ncbi:MAG: hypothetical protein M1814_004245 [Vezdaea aestivalis]|nr:MAG: hypothetical protein M1814_004245 [Vezdaea aestivalis]